MLEPLNKKVAICLLSIVGLSAYSTVANAPADLVVKLETAEGMIDAFYSFDATKLLLFEVFRYGVDKILAVCCVALLNYR